MNCLRITCRASGKYEGLDIPVQFLTGFPCYEMSQIVSFFFAFRDQRISQDVERMCDAVMQILKLLLNPFTIAFYTYKVCDR